MAKTCIWLCALALLLAWGAAARAQDQPRLLIHTGFNCFNYKAQEIRYCADWRIHALPGSRFNWSLLVYNIDRTKEKFSGDKTYDVSTRAQWLLALDTGLKWAAIARRERTDIEKRIAQVSEDTVADFVSTQEGRQAAVRFYKRDWTTEGPVYMYVPYEDDPRAKGSIRALIRAFGQCDANIKKMQETRSHKESLFK